MGEQVVSFLPCASVGQLVSLEATGGKRAAGVYNSRGDQGLALSFVADILLSQTIHVSSLKLSSQRQLYPMGFLLHGFELNYIEFHLPSILHGWFTKMANELQYKQEQNDAYWSKPSNVLEFFWYAKLV